MSLSEAVLEIANAIEEDAKQLVGDIPASTVLFIFKAFASQLRVAVKAAEGSQPPIVQVPSQPFLPTPMEQHRYMIEQAKQEFRKDRLREDVEERMVVVRGGPSNGDTVPLDPKMPVGGRCMIGGIVHELTADGVMVPLAGEGG